MLRRIGQPPCLQPCGQKREKTRTGKSCRAVTTKLRSSGHLSANAANIAKCLVEIIHAVFTLHCKVNDGEPIVNSAEVTKGHTRTGLDASHYIRVSWGRGEPFFLDIIS